MTVIVLKNIDFQGVSANNGMMVLGYPAMTAFNGLAHHVVRSYRKLFADETAKLLRFHVVHHDGSIRKHGFRVTNKRSINAGRKVERGERSDMNFTPQMQPGAQADIRASVVIEVALEPGIAMRARLMPDLCSILAPNGLGGRAVQDGSSSIAIVDGVEEALTGLPGGWLLVDQTSALFDGRAADPLDRMIDMLEAEISREPSERRQLLPTTVGFRAITDGASRKGSRDATADHYFAEPILGLAEFVRSYAARNAFGDHWIDRAAWKPVIDRAAGQFFVRQSDLAGSRTPTGTNI